MGLFNRQPEPKPEPCFGCACLLAPGAGKVVKFKTYMMIGYYDHKYCGNCKPPYDEQVLDVDGVWHYYARLEVTKAGRPKAAKR